MKKHDKVCIDCAHFKRDYSGDYLDLCLYKAKEVIGYSQIDNKPIYYGYRTCSDALDSFCTGNRMFARKLSYLELLNQFVLRLWARLNKSKPTGRNSE